MARLYAATGDGIARLDESGMGGRSSCPCREAARSASPSTRMIRDTVYAGLREGGVRRTVDGGQSWEDCGLPEPGVFSLAVSAAGGAVYAGTEPSRLFRSDDRGESWHELEALLELPSRPRWSFPPRPWTSHVRWIAPSPHDAEPAPGRDRARRADALERRRRKLAGPPSRRAARRALARLAPARSRDGRTRRAAAAPPSAPTQARPGSRPTRAATATTRGRSPSIPTTPTAGTCRRAPARTPPTAVATRRRASTGDSTGNRGGRSPAVCPSRCQRCPTRSSPPTVACSPASPTVRSGKAATRERAGALCGSEETRSARSLPSVLVSLRASNRSAPE